MREVVRMNLNFDAGLQVNSEAPHGQEPLDLLDNLACYVILMDLLVPVRDGISPIVTASL